MTKCWLVMMSSGAWSDRAEHPLVVTNSQGVGQGLVEGLEKIIGPIQQYVSSHSHDPYDPSQAYKDLCAIACSAIVDLLGFAPAFRIDYHSRAWLVEMERLDREKL